MWICLQRNHPVFISSSTRTGYIFKGDIMKNLFMMMVMVMVMVTTQAMAWEKMTVYKYGKNGQNSMSGDLNTTKLSRSFTASCKRVKGTVKNNTCIYPDGRTMTYVVTHQGLNNTTIKVVASYPDGSEAEIIMIKYHNDRKNKILTRKVIGK